MIRFATIGTNMITEWFLEGIPLCSQMEYAAVYSRSLERGKAFAKRYGVLKVFDNLEELAMDESIDAVYIASPPSCHFSQTMMMLNYGKHVLCEKPAASNAKEFELMMQAAKDNDVILLEAMKPVFTPGFQIIKEQIPKIAPIRRLTLQRCRYSSSYDSFKAGNPEHVFELKLSNGALMDIGCYPVHILVRLFGMPDRIQADAIKLSNGADGAGTILAHYDGMQAEILYSKIADTKVPSQIQGENGCLIIPDLSHPRKIQMFGRDGTEKVFRTERLSSESSRNNLIYETLEFQRLIIEHETEHSHNKYTWMELKVMDEARSQMEIRFPADKIMEV